MQRSRRRTEPDAQAVDGGAPMDAPAAESPAFNDDLIAQRAYWRFEERGGEHGRDLDDWLEAERELRGQSPIDENR